MDDLLDLNDVATAPTARVTRTWEPSVGGEYFATDQYGIFPRLAREHDVRISVEALANTRLRIRVSGTSLGYVKAAIAKMAAIEKPLVRLASFSLVGSAF